MTEYQDPPLRFTIDGLRWMGDEWEPTGFPPVPFDVWSTDADEDSSAILRGLRKIAARRLAMSLLALSAGHQALDFDAPNAPTEDDMQELITHAEHVLINLRALKQLAPEVIDDDGGDEEPSPEPAGSETA